jgi:hypothetical protein
MLISICCLPYTAVLKYGRTVARSSSGTSSQQQPCMLAGMKLLSTAQVIPLLNLVEVHCIMYVYSARTVYLTSTELAPSARVGRTRGVS